MNTLWCDSFYEKKEGNYMALLHFVCAIIIRHQIIDKALIEKRSVDPPFINILAIFLTFGMVYSQQSLKKALELIRE